jgi:hypothetical protein
MPAPCGLSQAGDGCRLKFHCWEKLRGRVGRERVLTFQALRRGPLGSRAVPGWPEGRFDCSSRRKSPVSPAVNNLRTTRTLTDIFFAIFTSFIQTLVSASPERHIVVSAIAPRLGHIEDSLQAAGFKVFSISPHARTLAANPLVVPEANATVLLETLAARRPSDPFPLVKSPNCVTCGISVVLKAIDDAFGVDSVAVTTFQALSGRGDAK